MRTFLGAGALLVVWAAGPAATAQPGLPNDSRLLGKWVNADTGVLVTTGHLGRLSRGDAGWTHTYFANRHFVFTDPVAAGSEGLFEGWIAAQYTAHRNYHTDGTESSTEAVDYRACRIELVGADSLRVSLSDTYAVHLANRIPEIRVPAEAQRRFARSGYTHTVLLRRLVD